MKKTLIATAIAGAMSFSVAAQAAPVVYGNIQVAVDVDGKASPAGTNAAEDTLKAFDNGSTLGVKGENAMEGGLTSFYKIEADVSAADAKTATTYMTGDQAYMGVKGGFGQVLVGSKDTLANDFVDDALVVGENKVAADSGFGNTAGEVAQLQYIGDFDGMKLGASVQLDGDEQGMQFAVAVPVGEMTVSGAFDTVDSNMGVAVVMPMGGLEVAGKFSTGTSVENNVSTDITVLAASASMDYSNGSAYGVFSMETESEVNSFGVGANYNVASNMYVYGEFGVENMEGTTVGAVLTF